MKRLTHNLLLLFLLVPALSTTARAQVNETDSLALVALYNATDGPNWRDNANWLTGSVASWYGVGVTGDRVTHLDLRFNQLTGSIPPELGNLTNLTLPVPEGSGGIRAMLAAKDETGAIEGGLK